MRERSVTEGEDLSARSLDASSVDVRSSSVVLRTATALFERGKRVAEAALVGRFLTAGRTDPSADSVWTRSRTRDAVARLVRVAPTQARQSRSLSPVRWTHSHRAIPALLATLLALVAGRFLAFALATSLSPVAVAGHLLVLAALLAVYRYATR